MRLVTYSVGPAGPPRAGVRVGHRILDIEAASRVKGEPLPSSIRTLLAAGRGALSRVQALAKAATTEARSFSHAMHEERAIRLLPPVPDADRFVCVDADFRAPPDKRAGHGSSGEPGMQPGAFPKLNASLVGHDARVARPQGIARLDCEPRLAFVIGRHALGVASGDAMEHVAGVTLLSDISCRDLQKRDEAAGAGARTERNFPGFSPLGPEIVTLDEIVDAQDLWITFWVNGTERRRASAGEQFLRFPAILEHFCRDLPVEPGDLFCLGAPGTAGAGEAGAGGQFLEPGDVVECSIQGVASLRTTIVAPGQG